jgi:peptide/nickel transport system substrate-binding protein
LLLAASAAAATEVAESARGSALAAAPFAQSWSHVPRTLAGRRARGVLVFGMEQDVAGFNTAISSEDAYWAAIAGNTPILRGTYMIDNDANYHLDLASSVTATKSSLTITIRPDAFWFWQGHPKMPVTNRDVLYTWRQIMNPSNDVVSRTGYDQITGYRLRGTKTIVFTWRKPFADYRDLFGLVYPSKALAGQNFNTLWSNCVCGADGAPVSDGPFYMSNYTKGEGLTLKANPAWYGAKPKLAEVDFKIVPGVDAEVQALLDGEVDAIKPSPQAAVSVLRGHANLVYSAVNGMYQEHVDIQLGPKSNPLLHAPWFRHALMMGMDRSSLIKALYGRLAPGLKPLDNLEYAVGPSAIPHFATWSFSQRKALDLLARHCTGGPSKPSADNIAIWTCSGVRAELEYETTTGTASRETSTKLWTQQLRSIGIQLDSNFEPATTVFGADLPNHDYDLAEYAWIGMTDPSGFDAVWSCGGASNYASYCNRRVTNLFDAGDEELDPIKRQADYELADKLMSNDLPAIPLYSQPSILVYERGITGMENSNNPTSAGPTWNIEQWGWSP